MISILIFSITMREMIASVADPIKFNCAWKDVLVRSSGHVFRNPIIRPNPYLSTYVDLTCDHITPEHIPTGKPFSMNKIPYAKCELEVLINGNWEPYK